ncbi:MAG: hypothetical protein HONBIEJF_01537 [Fimbriimonadaceae bacterium]|nr:hypothetical protein [Fimbriimonadaceae bacterium]
MTRRAAKSYVPPHSHSIASYLTLIEGRHHWTDSQGHIRWSAPGTWYFRLPDSIHEHERCPTDILALGIQVDLPALGLSAVPRNGSELRGEDADRITRTLLAELADPDSISELKVRAAFLELHAMMLRQGRATERPNSIVDRAQEWIDGRFLEPINLSAAARGIGVHPSHLARGFRSQLGVSVGDYIRDRRLEWARTRLADPTLKIAQIAIEAGFADQSHLTRLFTARYGRTPGAMRRDA